MHLVEYQEFVWEMSPFKLSAERCMRAGLNCLFIATSLTMLSRVLTHFPGLESAGMIAAMMIAFIPPVLLSVWIGRQTAATTSVRFPQRFGHHPCPAFLSLRTLDNNLKSGQWIRAKASRVKLVFWRYRRSWTLGNAREWMRILRSRKRTPRKR